MSSFWKPICKVKVVCTRMQILVICQKATNLLMGQRQEQCEIPWEWSTTWHVIIRTCRARYRALVGLVDRDCCIAGLLLLFDDPQASKLRRQMRLCWLLLDTKVYPLQTLNGSAYAIFWLVTHTCLDLSCAYILRLSRYQLSTGWSLGWAASMGKYVYHYRKSRTWRGARQTIADWVLWSCRCTSRNRTETGSILCAPGQA